METAAENVKGKLRSREHLKLELEMDDKEIKLQAEFRMKILARIGRCQLSSTENSISLLKGKWNDDDDDDDSEKARIVDS